MIPAEGVWNLNSPCWARQLCNSSTHLKLHCLPRDGALETANTALVHAAAHSAWILRTRDFLTLIIISLNFLSELWWDDWIPQLAVLWYASCPGVSGLWVPSYHFIWIVLSFRLLGSSPSFWRWLSKKNGFTATMLCFCVQRLLLTNETFPRGQGQPSIVNE